MDDGCPKQETLPTQQGIASFLWHVIFLARMGSEKKGKHSCLHQESHQIVPQIWSYSFSSASHWPARSMLKPFDIRFTWHSVHTEQYPRIVLWNNPQLSVFKTWTWPKHQVLSIYSSCITCWTKKNGGFSFTWRNMVFVCFRNIFLRYWCRYSVFSICPLVNEYSYGK